MVMFNDKIHLEVSNHTEIIWSSPVWKILDRDWYNFWWYNYGENHKSIALWNSFIYGIPPGPYEELKSGLLIQFNDPNDLLLFKLSI